MAPSIIKSALLTFQLLQPLTSAFSACPMARGIGEQRRDLLLQQPRALDLSNTLETLTTSFGKCTTISDAAGKGTLPRDLWPCQLRLDVLRQDSPHQNPLGGDFDYAAAFATLDYSALKSDIKALLTTSQDWWPADYGNYGPFFVRMAWHSAGTYRSVDGRGGAGMGQQRFEPLGSWPDNQNLDKARRLLWPLKQKYGQKISWADLIVLSGTVALESMGFPVLGFGAGRPDTWQADESIFWGAETSLVPEGNDIRYNGSTDYYNRAYKLEEPLGATHLGLIYVNPQGPDGSGDTKSSARDIRETFGRMGMNDSETVALIAGGHAFGKTHGNSAVEIGAAPAIAPLEQMDLGWSNSRGNGNADDTVTSGLEVVWTKHPTNWTNDYLNSLLGNTWTLTYSPAGAKQYVALNGTKDYPNPFNSSFRLPSMLVSDVALRDDPEYNKIATAWAKDFDGLTTAFAAAWFKLTHRDMGPIFRYLGPEVPAERFIWQDPVPNVTTTLITADDQATLSQQILAAGVDLSGLVRAAWGSVSTFRRSDKRGGGNGGRITLLPQVSWAVNNPTELEKTLSALKNVQANFNKIDSSKQVSLADLIVLGGNAAVASAASAAGYTVSVPFTAGRVDATQDQTDVATFEYLNPQADGFRNFRNVSGWALAKTEELLIDKAQQLSLTAPEMTVLVGGLRALNANYDGSATGILTEKPGTLTNDFFVNLLDINTVWTADSAGEKFTGKDRTSGKPKWTASRADLIFGSHSELRAIAEVYGAADGEQRFVNDFVKAWVKVQNLDRFDVGASSLPK